MTEHTSSPFSEVRCTQCGGARIKRADGSPGACSFIPCPAPLHDADAERGSVAPRPDRSEVRT